MLCAEVMIDEQQKIIIDTTNTIKTKKKKNKKKLQRKINKDTNSYTADTTMAFEFDSSTPLSIKNMDIRRPLRPLSTNNQRRPESYLKPASRPLKSILKNRIPPTSPTKEAITTTKEASTSKIDLFSSLKGMGSKIFQSQEIKPQKELSSTKSEFQTTKNDTTTKVEELTTKIQYLEKQVQLLENQNFALLRANKTNLLQKEMEKQDLEIQNQLLKREIESINKRRDFANDSDIIHSFKSKADKYDDDGAITKLSKMKNLYKMDDTLDDEDKNEEDAEMMSMRRKIQLRKQRILTTENDISERIAQMERNILVLSSRLANNEPPQSSDLVLLRQIKQILKDDHSQKKRPSDSEDRISLKKMRASLSDNEQLSPIRF